MINGADAIAILVLITIVIAIGVYLLHWLYRRSSKDRSFVRTGFRGEKIVMGGGALVIPIIHDITEVNMNAIVLEARRTGEKSLITKNKMRIDVVAEFNVRVIPTPDQVATAARTLGSRTLDAESLKELVQGRFIDAMSAAAANMTMDEIHSNRIEFMKTVGNLVSDTLNANGLELENASLTNLNQSDISVFNPANAFDAEGLTQLTQQVEEKREARNLIENDTLISIKTKDYETERRSLEIDRDTQYARIDQHREVEIRRSVQQAEIEEEKAKSTININRFQISTEREAEKERIDKQKTIETENIQTEQEIRKLELDGQLAIQVHETDTAKSIETQQISNRQEIETARIIKEEEVKLLEISKTRKVGVATANADRHVNDAIIANNKEIDELRIAAGKYVEKFEIEQQKEVELVDKERLIAIINKSIEEATAQTKAAEAWKVEAALSEQITTARQQEIAERSKLVEMIDATAKSEREAFRVVTLAKADKDVAEQRALAEIAGAKASEVRYEKDADGQRKLNEAENMRNTSNRRSAIYENLVKNLPSIIRETVKPIENIESIKILQVDGVPGINSPSETISSPEQEGGGGNMTDKIVSSAMKYRTQMAFVDGLMKELGLPLENIGSAGGMSFRNFPSDDKKQGKDGE